MNRLEIIKALIKMYNDSYYGIPFIERILNRCDQLSNAQLQSAYACAVTQYKQRCEKNHIKEKTY